VRLAGDGASVPLAGEEYGWAKASYELLGHPYACRTFGRSLEVVMLRIGSPYPIQPARYAPGAAAPASTLPRPAGVAAFKRALGAWLSDRDCAQLCQVSRDRAQAGGARCDRRVLQLRAEWNRERHALRVEIQRLPCNVVLGELIGSGYLWPWP
jgi:hypothetical protein